MQTTSLQPQLPVLGKLTQRKYGHMKKVLSPVFATRGNANNDKGRDRVNGKVVDENMIVLRMRIQELKTEEMKNNVTQTELGIEREEEWCKDYELDVLGAVGVLQRLLMDTRPSFVLAVVALMIFSASTSLAVVIGYLMHFMR